jgi:nanoRNase/pAp phosphatase (c-di-AMP/oligoRNAs hydrolase)
LQSLLEHKADARVALAYGGVLGRAENRAMVRLLKIPLVPFTRVDPREFDVVALVDTQPGHGNHRLTAELVRDKRLVCIDHHPRSAIEPEAPAVFADIGGDYGATSTMLTAYLASADVGFDEPVATALFYGIKSDTRDLGREVGETDVWAYQHLISHTDMALISQIEHPRLPRGYFAALSNAVRKARTVGEVVVCDLGQVYVPDLVAETADWLLLAEGIRWSLVVGEHGDDVFCSLRVSDRRFSAGKLVRDVIATWENASAGGHGSMAGGKVSLDPTLPKSARARVRKKLLRALLAATGADMAAPARPFTEVVTEPEGNEPTAPTERRLPKRGASAS